MSDWTPIEDNTPNPFNERMKNYKQPFNLPGCIAYIFMALIVVGFIVLILNMFGCIIDLNCLTWLR